MSLQNCVWYEEKAARSTPTTFSFSPRLREALRREARPTGGIRREAPCGHAQRLPRPPHPGARAARCTVATDSRTRAPLRSGRCGSAVGARWSPKGRLRAGQAAQEREWIHLDRDRPVSVGLLQGDAYQPGPARLAQPAARSASLLAPWRASPIVAATPSMPIIRTKSSIC